MGSVVYGVLRTIFIYSRPHVHCEEEAYASSLPTLCWAGHSCAIIQEVPGSQHLIRAPVTQC